MRGAHEDRQVGEQQRREDEVGLGRLQRRDVRRQVERSDFRPLLGDDLDVDAELLQQRLERGHVVAAVRVVGVDAGDRRELALPVLDRQQRPHHRLALVVGAAEDVARIRHRLLDAVLRGAVPEDQQRLHLLGDRAHRQAHAGGHDALHAVDLVLQHELAQALDRVLRIGFFLDDQLDLAAGDAAGGVDALDRELRAAQAAFADGAGDAGLRRDDADPQRHVLRDRRKAQIRLRCDGRAGAADGLQ